MDSSAVNVNVTVDDFDSVVSYADQSVWQTPDPSSPTFNDGPSPWWMRTFHRTDAINASVTFNFTGPAIYIFGASGASYGSYEVIIDGTSSVLSAYSLDNSSSPHLLYGAADLAYNHHTLILRNLGAKAKDMGGNSFLFDFLQTTVELAPAGQVATVSNITIEETDPSLKFRSKWGHNQSPNFSGGGTAFTNENKASVSFTFHGSAIYVFGDKKNDHGLYGVTLDNGTTQVFNDVSGCGGAFGMTCEQQLPTLKYLASNLDESLHSMNIENIAGVNNSFFDLDSIVVTVPSRYAPRQLTNSSSTSSASPSTSPSRGSGNGTSMNAPPSIILIFLTLFWLFRSCIHD